MGNPFDAFDQPPPDSSNVFDRFDSSGTAVASRTAVAPDSSLESLQAAGVDTQAPEDSYYALPKATRDKYDAKADAFKEWAQKPTVPAQYLPPYWLGQGAEALAKTDVLPESVNQGLESYAGYNKGLGEVMSGFSSPMNAAMLPLGATGKLGQVVLGSAFEAQAIKAFPAMWEQFKNESDPQKKAQLATTMAIGLGLPAMAPFHAGMESERSLPKSSTPDPPLQSNETILANEKSEPTQEQPGLTSQPTPASQAPSQAVPTPVQEALQTELARAQPQGIPQVTQDPLAPQLGAEIPTEEIAAALKQRGFSPDEVAQILKDEFGRNAQEPPPSGAIVPDEADFERRMDEALSGKPASPTVPSPDELSSRQAQAGQRDTTLRGQPEVPTVGGSGSESSVSGGRSTEIPSSQPAGTSNRQFEEIYGKGAVPSGEGVDAAELLDNARADIRTGRADPYSVLSKTRQRGVASPDEYAILAAEHERLVNDAVAKEKAGAPSAGQAAQQANDFATAIQPHKTAASDLFRLMQGDLNYDLGTTFGIDQYMKSEIGRNMKPSERPTFERRANQIRQGERNVAAAVEAADARVRARYRGVKEISIEEAAARVKALLSDCLV